VGDLGLLRFGLSEEQWDELAGLVDCVYHSASLVNFLYPYRALKNANVRGAEEVLRLAATTKIKAVHFISTLSTYAHGEHLEGDIMEDAPLAPGKDIFGGYSQSKWVSERVAMLAREAGLPVSIYRPGRITGHAVSGVGNVDDFMCRMIKGCIELQCAPRLEWEEKCASVDFCAKTVVYVGMKPEALGKNYHLVHSEAFLWSHMFEWIKEFGYKLEVVEYEQWYGKLTALGEGGKSNAMYALLPLLHEANGAAAVMPTFDCSNVLELTADGNFTCAATDQELMIRYLDYFVKCGFLDSPVSSDILPSAFSAGGGLGEVGNLDGFVDEEDESFLVGGEMEC